MASSSASHVIINGGVAKTDGDKISKARFLLTSSGGESPHYEFTISNGTDDVLVFKVKTTHKSRYYVKPKRKILDDRKPHRVRST